MIPRRRKLFWIAPFALFALAVVIALGGFIVRFLWNALLPPLFGLHEVSFWQALGLLVLARILFGGFRLSGGGRSRLRDRMSERWAAKMTPEERERLRQEMLRRCGFEPPPDEGTAKV